MFTPHPTNILIAALAAGGVALAAGILRQLTFSGALAAFAVGVFTFGFGRAAFAVPLLAFFISSSLLSHIGNRRKASANEQYAKSGPRDAAQVLANGGIPAVLAVVFLVAVEHPKLGWTRPLMMCYLAALAAVNADTWATEIGGLFGIRPRLVTTLRKVDPGVSGAVSLPGLLAAAAGAAFIVFAGWAAWPARTTELLWRIDAPEMIAVAWAGFVAAYLDSLLGATVQVHYRCGHCGALTERPSHCGAPAAIARGWRWVNNDVVNLAASASGVVFAWSLLRYFAYPM